MLTSLSEMTLSIFPSNNQNGDFNDELVLITDDKTDYLDTSTPVLWSKIYHAWKEMQFSHPGTKMRAWRNIFRYGEEIVPGLRVFRLRQNESEKPCYFYLLSEEDFFKALSRLNDLFCILSAWQHIKRGQGFFHAAGVVCENSAYLFIGTSGSGKSTICSLSARRKRRKCTTIHDDHVVVYPNEQGKYEVSDRTLLTSGVPLRALFFLNQATNNHLVPLSQLETAKGLLDSSFDMAQILLHGQLLQNTFFISADIARCVPGYNLYFRKSPDFWDVIDAEFRNEQHY